ncbi:hypothetical protein HYX04_04040 [Candidatus Woesearchaeota archaeon]|nr:hypothetical protein [Candidatus Woesearchaeota archaeon]
MKINRYVVLVLFTVSLLALTVASQISQVTNAISVEEIKTCTTSFYDEVQNIYGNCVYYNNYTSCLNTSGSNTDCSLVQDSRNLSCKTGEIIIKKNSTECQPPTKFIVSSIKDSITEKKEIDFSSWGACVQNTENDCLIVTCVSLYDGAHNGQFTDCKGGKSCQKFQFCKDSVKVLYKNSRDDFVEYDPSFYLPQLAIKEVGK